MKKLTLAVALLCSASYTTVFAQSTNYNPSWYVAPSISKFDPDNRFGVDKNGEGLGLRFGKPLSEYWDLQVGATSARAKEKFGAAHNEATHTYNQQSLGVDALLMLSRSSIRPYFLVGTGLERDHAETPTFSRSRGNSSSESETSPYVSAGLGLQIDLSEQWSLQADARRQQGQLKKDTFFMNKSNNNIYSIGLNYVFDKVVKPAPVVVAPAPAPVVVVAPVAPPPPPPPAPRFEKFTLSSTELFAFDSAVLKMPQPKLDEIATALKANSSVTNVTISGYTDRLGSDKYNLKLSDKRANSVRDYLVNVGVAANRITAVGKGEANPVVECKMKKRAELIQCLEPNRRVEVDQMTFERRVK